MSFRAGLRWPLSLAGMKDVSMSKAYSRGNGLLRFLSTKPSPGGKDAAKPAVKTKSAAPASKGANNKNAAAKRDKKDNEKTIAESLTKFMMASEEAKAFKPDFSDEELAEHAKIGRIYQQRTTQRHNRLQKDLATKVWLQHDALRSLPDNLRVHAEIIDDTPPPPDRPWPYFQTPPIKDFDAKQFMGKNDDEDDDGDEATAAAGDKDKEKGRK